jgi:hypothetical protein
MRARESKPEEQHITFLGDSTLDNRLWVEGLSSSYLKAKLGIKPQNSSIRIQQSRRRFCKTSLSIIEHVTDLLPGYTIHDYTNDGFTTKDCLHGAFRDKVFGEGNFSLFPHVHFSPLEEGEESIRNSQNIVLSVGGNNFREFLLKMSIYRKKSAEFRAHALKSHFQEMLETTTSDYLVILQKIRAINKNARIILMTQYYPSCSQNNYGIYEFMKELGVALNKGGLQHDPMTVIHEIMRLTYKDILGSIEDSNVVIADITSSLDPYNSSNYVYQIEPSSIGGKKIAQILQYMITHTNPSVRPGHSYHFLPEFFTADPDDQKKHIVGHCFNEWEPTHPITAGSTREEEKIFRQHKANELSHEDLLTQLEKALDNKHPLRNVVSAIVEEGRKLAPKISIAQTRSFKMSIVLAINLVTCSQDMQPEAVRLLQTHATQSAIGKENYGRKFIGALLMLTGAMIVSLSVAGIPFTGGASIVGLYVAGGLIAAGGFGFYHCSKRTSLSEQFSNLLKEESSPEYSLYALTSRAGS